MSFLMRAPRFVAARHFVPAVAGASRSFAVSSALKLKESDRGNPDQAEKNDFHIKDQLQKQKEGKGHWKPELASDSEEAVAADRHEHDDHSAEGIKALQDKTAKHAEEKHK